MIPLASSATITAAALKSTALKTAVALTAVATGATLFAGTAQAATPAVGAMVASPAMAQNVSDYPRFDPRRRGFRAHFRTYGECAFFANHDRNPRTNGWDCRHGGNRAFPWQYWY